jgi:lysine/ornithine N-monooxygenase
MKPPSNSSKTGGRLTGEVMSEYMESFAALFLRNRITYSTEVLEIRRGNNDGWVIKSRDLTTNTIQEYHYSKIVLCTGVSNRFISTLVEFFQTCESSQGCSNPCIPPLLSPQSARASGFQGLILHSSQFNEELPNILAAVKTTPSKPGADPGRVVIIGCGKSAQEYAAFFTITSTRV